MKSLLKCVSAILKTINTNGTIEFKDVLDRKRKIYNYPG